MQTTKDRVMVDRAPFYGVIYEEIIFIYCLRLHPSRFHIRAAPFRMRSRVLGYYEGVCIRRTAARLGQVVPRREIFEHLGSWRARE
jgi:hypothetical protein